MITYKSINYLYFPSLDSTNTRAKEYIHQVDPDTLICIVAEEQTAGRGKFSAKWFSPKGVNIYATFVFTLPKSFPFLSNLGQILSVSCCQYLETSGFFPQIKWPNDLLLEGKKFAGFLCETTPLQERTGVILGLGVNVNMTEEQLITIDQPATSLREISGNLWSLKTVLTGIADRFSENFTCLSSKGFSPFRAYYEEHLLSKGKKITVLEREQRTEGICQGVSEDGFLILSTENGKSISITSGLVITNN